MGKISGYLIAFSVFTLIILGGLSILGEFNSKGAGFTADSDYVRFNKSFNQYDELSGSINTLNSSIANQDNPDAGNLGFLNALVGTSWSVLKNIFGTFSFTYNIFSGLGEVFGVPSWAVVIIIGIVVITIVFAIFGAVFQRDL